MSLKYSLIGLTVLLMVSCAALGDLYRETPHRTFELTISGEKVAVNLPDRLPSMTSASLASDRCFVTNESVCVQRFHLSTEAIHDDADFVYNGVVVLALVWFRSDGTNQAWIYLGKKPILVPFDEVKELIKKFV